MARSFKLTFPPGFPLLSANGREHWSRRARKTANLRQMSYALSRQARIPQLEEVDIIATYFPPDRRRRDAPNVLAPSSKACIDGMVDAGVIPDDRDKYVRSVKFIPGQTIVRGGQLVIEIAEAGGDGGHGD